MLICKYDMYSGPEACNYGDKCSLSVFLSVSLSVCLSLCLSHSVSLSLSDTRTLCEQCRTRSDCTKIAVYA